MARMGDACRLAACSPKALLGAIHQHRATAYCREEECFGGSNCSTERPVIRAPAASPSRDLLRWRRANRHSGPDSRRTFVVQRSLEQLEEPARKASEHCGLLRRDKPEIRCFCGSLLLLENSRKNRPVDNDENIGFSRRDYAA